MINERINNSITEPLRDFENSEKIKKVEVVLIDFLVSSPPEVGHGYSHFKKVARESYLLGEKEKVDRLDLLYISGLCHDIYRPANGQGAQEDHEVKSGEIIFEIFKSVLPKNDLDLIIQTIVNHDEAIIGKQCTKMMDILSLVDKKDMSAQRWMAYAWASNKNNGKNKPYKNFENIFESFKRYRLKAFKVFDVVDLNTYDAIEAYGDTDLELSFMVEQEKLGRIKFSDEYVKMAKKEAKQDIEYLKRDEVDENLIKKITSNYRSLLAN